jgi:Family of unknown function (DUF6445)
MFPPDLFAISPKLSPRMERIGGVIPVIIIDDFYQRPDDLRTAALSLSYDPPPYPYPGKLAQIPPDPTFSDVLKWALDVVNRSYLPNVPPIAFQGKPLGAFGKVYSDFAVIDVHPDDLAPVQRIPHTDPVPVFGLVYLNREERGGTMFFDQTAPVDTTKPDPGYITDTGRGFRLMGRIEAAFNRMAIYPGFVPHSGEIAGEWIKSDERFRSPRLTQRFIFTP